MYDVRRDSWIVEEVEDAENEPEKVAKYIHFQLHDHRHDYRCDVIKEVGGSQVVEEGEGGKKKMGNLVKNIAFAIEFDNTKVFDISKAEGEEEG